MKAMKVSIIAMVMFATTSLYAQEYVVDVDNSTLKWHGKKVTGEHWGHINLKEGSMVMDKDQIKSGMFVIDMKSITNDDLKDEGYNQKLVGHLKSDDFFGVENHPEAMLKIKKSTPFKNNKATVDAHLTIKGITHPITFETQRNGNEFVAEIVVDRSKYDVRYGSGSFFDNLGDKMIYDDFTMTVNLKVSENSQASL